MAQQPCRAREGAGACTRVSVCLCVFVCGARAGLGPAESPHPLPGAAGSGRAAPIYARPPQPHAQVAVRPGRGRVRILSGCRTKAAVRVLEPSCSAGAWPTVRLALSSHAKFLSLECLLFYLPLCSGRRRAAPREEGLKNTGACSAVAALPALVGVRCPSAGTAAPRPARADARREREEGG